MQTRRFFSPAAHPFAAFVRIIYGTPRRFCARRMVESALKMPDVDLNSLLQKCGRGDRAAFRTLYDCVAPRIMAIGLRMLGDHHQAEDVLQQTMIAVWDSASGFDPAQSQATTWLTSIARYRSIDMLRKSERQRMTLRDDKENILSVMGHDAPFRASDPIPSSTAARLEKCFGEISLEQASCIQLAYLDGLTFSEIAVKLEKSIGTVKSWVRRGLEKLRKCVER